MFMFRFLMVFKLDEMVLRRALTTPKIQLSTWYKNYILKQSIRK